MQFYKNELRLLFQGEGRVWIGGIRKDPLTMKWIIAPGIEKQIVSSHWSPGEPNNSGISQGIFLLTVLIILSCITW